MGKNKVTKWFSGPLMKQNIKANWLLCLVILIIMMLMSNVVNFAMSIMENDNSDVDVSQYQEEFYVYLGAMATYDKMTGSDLSYEDFAAGEKNTKYENAFKMISAQSKANLNVDGFQKAIDGLSKSDIDLNVFVKEFQYSYALAQAKGVFDGKDLEVSDMLQNTLTMMGISPDLIENMSTMDTSAMINQMYFTVIGLLPIFILIVVLANGLIADRVDRGSMAYVLSTPTKRSAVTFTQGVFLVVVPLLIISIVMASRIGTTFLLFDDVNVPGIVACFAGMYVLVEAVCGICYFGSCIFSQSKRAIGFGGGLATWFFLASLLGMFGSDNMINTGMGVEELGIFNKLTLIGLFDLDSLSTVGTEDVDYTFVWKLGILAVIAVVAYVAGAIRFNKKDLPL